MSPAWLLLGRSYLLLAASALPNATTPNVDGSKTEARASTASQPALRVQILRVTGDDELFARLRAELRAAGFECESEIPTVPSGDPGGVGVTVHSTLERQGMGAVVALDSTPASVRIWIDNADTGKRIFREVRRELRTDPDNAIVALWAVELLRATEFAPPEPTPTQVNPLGREPAREGPAPVVSELRAHPRTFSLQWGPALGSSPGGLNVAYQLALGARWSPRGRWGLETTWFLPLVPVALERQHGSALVSTWIASAGAFVSLNRPTAPWVGDVGVGVSAVLLTAIGTNADAPYATEHDRLLAFGPSGHIGGRARLSNVLGLRGDLFGGAALPRPVILFGDERVATWGRPWVTARVGIEVMF